MKIKVTSSTLVGGVWHEPGVGEYTPELAQHLIQIGSAVLAEPEIEKKIMPPNEVKKKVNATQYSQQVQVSQKKIAKKSKKQASKQ